MAEAAEMNALVGVVRHHALGLVIQIVERLAVWVVPEVVSMRAETNVVWNVLQRVPGHADTNVPGVENAPDSAQAVKVQLPKVHS